MAKAIPIDQVVTINPGVIGTGSNPLALNGVFIGQSNLIPVGSLLTFYDRDSVSDWFGSASVESELATVYFNGFTNARKYPEQIFYYAIPTAGRGAWARGRSLKGMLLSELKAITGELSVSINGTAHNTADFNLSAATSFSDGAQIIQTALGIDEVATVTWDAMTSRYVITVTASAATSEISQITGTAAAPLGLDGAVLSQGTTAVSITDTLNAIKELSLNWATFTFIEQNDQDEMVEIAKWVNSQNSRYLWINSDNDPNARLSGNETNFGYLAGLAAYDGTMNVYDANTNPLTKAFAMGTAASVDWKRLNGRVNIAFRNQSGLPTTCDNLTDAEALLSNGYSYYGQYAASGPSNTYAFLYNGQLPGKFKWFDTYINQIYLNSQLQKAMIDMLMAANFIPYNQQGYGLIRSAALDPILEAINNGSIQAGIPLSESQKAQIIQQVGFDITRELYTDGWYLQIVDADTQTRGNRESPPINFFYCDGGSIQKIVIPSIVIL